MIILLENTFKNQYISFYRRQCGVNMNNDTSRSYYENLGLEESVPDYFAGTVLLRTSPRYPQSFTGELRFQTLFNIVVIWMAVFIGLSKGRFHKKINKSFTNNIIYYNLLFTIICFFLLLIVP